MARQSGSQVQVAEQHGLSRSRCPRGPAPSPLQEGSVEPDGMGDSTLHSLPLSFRERPGTGAPRGRGHRQDSRRHYGADDFAIVIEHAKAL